MIPSRLADSAGGGPRSSWKGRVAVVTGAGSGIGRALAERFAQVGMRLVLADVEAEPLAAAVAALRAAG